MKKEKSLAGVIARTAVECGGGPPRGTAHAAARDLGVPGVSALPAARGAGVAVVLFLAACASSMPLRFYMLSEVPPSSASDAPSGAPAIRIGRVRIPAELDRSELVQRIDANRVRISEQDRWAAPLDEMVRRVLSANLLSRTTEPQPATLTVDIDELMGDTNCAVTLKASWEIKGAVSAPPTNAGGAADTARAPVHAVSGHEVIRVAPPGGSACSIAALPQSMSHALAELTDRIVAARR